MHWITEEASKLIRTANDYGIPYSSIDKILVDFRHLAHGDIPDYVQIAELPTLRNPLDPMGSGEEFESGSASFTVHTYKTDRVIGLPAWQSYLVTVRTPYGPGVLKEDHYRTPEKNRLTQYCEVDWDIRREQLDKWVQHEEDIMRQRGFPQGRWLCKSVTSYGPEERTYYFEAFRVMLDFPKNLFTN